MNQNLRSKESNFRKPTNQIKKTPDAESRLRSEDRHDLNRGHNSNLPPFLRRNEKTQMIMVLFNPIQTDLTQFQWRQSKTY